MREAASLEVATAQRQVLRHREPSRPSVEEVEPIAYGGYHHTHDYRYKA